MPCTSRQFNRVNARSSTAAGSAHWRRVVVVLLLVGGWLLWHQPQQALPGIINWLASARTFSHQESLQHQVAVLLAEPEGAPTSQQTWQSNPETSHHAVPAPAPSEITWQKLPLFWEQALPVVYAPHSDSRLGHPLQRWSVDPVNDVPRRPPRALLIS